MPGPASTISSPGDLAEDEGGAAASLQDWGLLSATYDGRGLGRVEGVCRAGQFSEEAVGGGGLASGINFCSLCQGLPQSQIGTFISIFINPATYLNMLRTDTAASNWKKSQLFASFRACSHIPVEYPCQGIRSHKIKILEGGYCEGNKL